MCAYRQVYDGVKEMKCEVDEIPLNKEMVLSCKHARQRYSVYLDEQKKQKQQNEAEEKRKACCQNCTVARGKRHSWSLKLIDC